MNDDAVFLRVYMNDVACLYVINDVVVFCVYI